MSKTKNPSNKETQEVVSLLTTSEVREVGRGDITEETSTIQQANAKRIMEDQNKDKNSNEELLARTDGLINMSEENRTDGQLFN